MPKADSTDGFCHHPVVVAALRDPRPLAMLVSGGICRHCERALIVTDKVIACENCDSPYGSRLPRTTADEPEPPV